MTVGIYQIKNIITGEIYIGQSTRLNLRKAEHFRSLINKNHCNIYLQRSFNIYGIGNFVFRILLYCEPFELTHYEQGFVDQLKPRYNLHQECVNSAFGIRLSEEHKLKLSLAHKGKHWTENQRIKFKEIRKGHSVSDEAKQKSSESQRGKTKSQDTRQRMSEAAQKRFESEEERHKVSMTLLGKPGHLQTPETKYKISRARIGIKFSEEAKRKMAQAKIGKPSPRKGCFLSKETRHKLSESHKAYWQRKHEQNQ